MARKIGFYKAITDTDDFFELPASTRLLYFELGMQANEKGHILAPRTLMRTTGAKASELEELIRKHFITIVGDYLIITPYENYWRLVNGEKKDV